MPLLYAGGHRATFACVARSLVGEAERRHLSALRLGVTIGRDAGQDYASFANVTQADAGLLDE